MRKEQRRDEDQRQGKGDIPDPSQFLTRRGGYFPGKKIQHHRRPAGIAAPAASEQEGPEDLCHRIMDRRGLKNTGEQVIPEALELHIFIADKTEIDQHIQAYKQLDDTSGMRVFPDVQKHAQSNGTSDVAEVEKIKNVVLRQP